MDTLAQLSLEFDERWDEMLAWWEEVSYGVTPWSTAPNPHQQTKGRAKLFVDHFEHSLDAKHRLVLPSSFRKILGDRVYLAPQDNSLGVYSVDEFEAVANRLLDQVRAKEADPQMAVAFASKSVITSIDKAGRVTIPERLRSYANLSDEVIVAGVITHVQIWARDRYEAMQQRFDDVVTQQFQSGGAIN